MDGFEISKTPVEIPIEYKGKKQIFKMRELNSDDVWEIQKQTQSISKEGILSLDQSMRNKLFLAKSVLEPALTLETVAQLPHQVTQILIECFNKMHYLNEEEVKKNISSLNI